MFITCMFFHGELAAMKPSPRYLTSFYLMVSLGGALGGVLVGLVAPKIFPTYYEFGVGLVMTLVLAAWLTRGALRIVPALAVVGALFTGYHIVGYVKDLSEDAQVLTRNFYGTLRVRDTGPASDPAAMRRLLHGVIMHGEQYLNPARQMEATTYYGKTSGIGRLTEIQAATLARMSPLNRFPFDRTLLSALTNKLRYYIHFVNDALKSYVFLLAN